MRQQIGDVTLIHGDCLRVMPTLKAGSVSLVFADLPYKTTALAWDVALDQNAMWSTMMPCLASNVGAVFTADLRLSHTIMSHSPLPYAYDMVYLKAQATGFMNAKRAPLRAHELVLYFARGKRTYAPQMFKPMVTAQAAKGRQSKNLPIYGAKYLSEEWRDTGLRYPISVLTPALPKSERGLHPTQKPIDLIEWLMRSFSAPGDLVLDPCSGSGSTAIAAMRNGRRAVCIEKDPVYFDAMVKRVTAEHAKQSLVPTPPPCLT